MTAIPHRHDERGCFRASLAARGPGHYRSPEGGMAPRSPPRTAGTPHRPEPSTWAIQERRGARGGVELAAWKSALTLTVSAFTRGAGPGGACVLPASAVRPLPGYRAGGSALAEGTPAAGAVRSHGTLPGERAMARETARQAQGRRGNVPGTGSPATGRPAPGQPAHPACDGRPRCRRGGPPARFPGRNGDGQQNWQTVYPGSRTCRPSTPPANLLANTYTCRQRSAVAAVNAQDVAVINLPVNSQTYIRAQLVKQS